MGCSVHSVPSLSKQAMRSGTGTQSGPPRVVVRAMKSRIDRFTGPSFQEGSASAWANPGRTVPPAAIAPAAAAIPIMNDRRFIAGSGISRRSYLASRSDATRIRPLRRALSSAS